VTVASFLLLVQILNGLGGAGVAFLTIKKDIEGQGLKEDDPLPDHHLQVVKLALAPATGSCTAEGFIAMLER
jgi:hypothetical protein